MSFSPARCFPRSASKSIGALLAGSLSLLLLGLASAAEIDDARLQKLFFPEDKPNTLRDLEKIAHGLSAEDKKRFIATGMEMHGFDPDKIEAYCSGLSGNRTQIQKHPELASILAWSLVNQRKFAAARSVVQHLQAGTTLTTKVIDFCNKINPLWQAVLP